MTAYKTGVHTVELTTNEAIDIRAQPPEYKAAIDILGKGVYKVNVARLPGMQEYSPLEREQRALNDMLEAYRDENGDKGRITRIDYRLDNHDTPYQHEYDLMCAFVHVMAYRYGMTDRLYETTRRFTQTKLNVRFMPGKDEDGTRGVEYYNKAEQKQTTQYGFARLEFRRMNLTGGETIADVLRAWRTEIKAVTHADYMDMLRDASQALLLSLPTGKPLGSGLRQVRNQLIGKEQERIVRQLAGGAMKHRPLHGDLPDWKQLKVFMKTIVKSLTK